MNKMKQNYTKNYTKKYTKKKNKKKLLNCNYCNYNTLHKRNI